MTRHTRLVNRCSKVRGRFSIRFWNLRDTSESRLKTRVSGNQGNAICTAVEETYPARARQVVCG
eukprot:7061538-Pyramimonas_sp.AAC.1